MGGPKQGEGSSGEKGNWGKKLSQVELQERSRKGLCFKCGERWGQDHICKMKRYSLLLVEGSDDDEIAEKGDEGIGESSE